jgi:type VI secretion system secreted protein VgrG
MSNQNPQNPGQQGGQQKPGQQQQGGQKPGQQGGGQHKPGQQSQQPSHSGNERNR